MKPARTYVPTLVSHWDEDDGDGVDDIAEPVRNPTQLSLCLRDAEPARSELGYAQVPFRPSVLHAMIIINLLASGLLSAKRVRVGI